MSKPQANDEYSPAPDYVVDLCQELIRLYHKGLEEASIGLLMRHKTSRVNGVVTLGKAKKLPKDVAVYMNLDFIIWLDYDWWGNHLNDFQRRALLDHELCHCQKIGKRKSIMPHDIEEFAAIIQRYGFWRPFSTPTIERAIQSRFEFVANHGKVASVDPKYLAFLFDLSSLDTPDEEEIEEEEEAAEEEAPQLAGEELQPPLIPAGEDTVDETTPAADVDILDQVDDLLNGEEGGKDEA